MNIRHILQRVASFFGLFIARYNQENIYIHKTLLSNERFKIQSDDLFYSITKPVVEAGRTLLSYDRLYVLWQAIRNTYQMQLPAVEVGSYRGGSAYFLASAFKELLGHELSIHIFDTFEGHPQKMSKFDDTRYHFPGHFGDTNYEEVKAYLKPFTQLQIHKGEFSESINTLDDMTYSLVHIDVDLYHPTLDCLEYFGSRLASGGIIIVDDYGAKKCPGVNSAVVEYLSNKQFQVWHMRTEQVVLVKQ